MIAKSGNRFSQKNIVPKQKIIGGPEVTKLDRTPGYRGKRSARHILPLSRTRFKRPENQAVPKSGTLLKNQSPMALSI
jgi:hypothetical protein